MCQKARNRQKLFEEPQYTYLAYAAGGKRVLQVEMLGDDTGDAVGLLAVSRPPEGHRGDRLHGSVT